VAAGLSDDDVREVRAEVAAGRSAAVWFTAAAVGVPAGRSAKVVAVGDASEGEFLQVRPAGSKDTVSCSPDELTRTRPARRRPDPEPAPSARTPRAASGSAAASPTATSPTAAPSRATPARPAESTPVPTPSTATSTGPAATRTADLADLAPTRSAAAPPRSASARPAESAPADSAPTRPAEDTDGRPVRRPAAAKRSAAATTGGTDTAASSTPPAAAPASATRTSGRPRSAPDPLSVCLTATPEGEWSVEVLAGKKRVVPLTPVPAGALAAAARSLPPAVAEAIESSLEHARQRQRERVARLREELDAAQRVLEEFDA
jgi:hypothetical protein